MRVWINQTNNIVWNDDSNHPITNWRRFFHDGVQYETSYGVIMGWWMILK